MAQASGAAAENLIPGSFRLAAAGVEYTVAKEGTDAELTVRNQSADAIAERHKLSYFLGSGHLGTTYLYSIDKYLFESPVAWYAPSNGYDMKPGLGDMKEMPPALPMESGCLRCHMSTVQPSDAGTINRYSGLPFLHTGITCEACHGDAQRHVQTAGKIAVVNPARLDPERRDSVCISCHLEGDVSVERAGHSVLDYEPGKSISDYLAFYVYSGNSLTARGVSEVEQLAQSTCKRMSGTKMSCTSCHDPHFTPTPEQRASFFRSKCLACHKQPQFAASHHAENPDCTSCHMRHTGAANIPHVAWTDHRILREPFSLQTNTVHGMPDELSPVFSPGATQRDLAMAYYKKWLESGNQAAEVKAWTLLKQQHDTIANDKDALDAFGNMTAGRGDIQDAEQAFEQVLKLDPHDLTAISNLGILRAKQGRMKESIALLAPAFEANKDVTGLAMNLARVQCMAGDGAGARATVETALIYAPGMHKLRELRDETSECGTQQHAGAEQ
jgi:predicted CXXCH cytochrome family protein